MDKQTVIDSIHRYFESAGIEDSERGGILTYVTDESGKKPMPDASQKNIDHRLLAEVCEPIFSTIAAMEKNSESFACAYRFWEYLQNFVRFDFSEVYPAVMQEFAGCGLSYKEAMLLDLVVTDFSKRSPVQICGYQADVMQECLKNQPQLFADLRQTLYGLTEREICLSERTKSYYASFIYGTAVAEMRAANSDSDFKEMFSKFELSIDLVGKRAASDLEWYFRSAPRTAMEAYIKYLDGSGDALSLFKKHGDENISYRMQFYCLSQKGYSKRLDGFLAELFKDDAYMDRLLSADSFAANSGGSLCGNGLYAFWQHYFDEASPQRKKEVMRRVFIDERTADFAGEGLFEPLSAYLSSVDDPDTAFNALCYARSKKVVTFCLSMVADNRKAMEQAVRAASMRKLPKDNAQAIKAVLDKWNDEQSADQGFADIAAVEAFAAGEKLTAAKLLEPFDFTVPVYAADKKTRVSEHTLKVFADKYFSMKEIYRNRRCDGMAAHLDPVSFQAFIDRLYAVWENSEYDNKLKAAVVPYCFYTSNDRLLKLKKKCVEFCDSGRHTLSAYIIKVIAMNGGKYALMLVDSIANKFPYPKSKQVAREAMAAAAAKYEIPVDVLGDMIIPACGFGPDGKAVWGELTLTLLPDGDVRINRGDKTLKSLPSDTGAETKKHFSALKKDVKTVITLQSVRLERALMTGRCWRYKDFVRNFVAHPVMRLLISRLILGTYTQDGTLKTAFRIGPDGRAENADYDEVSVEPDDTVALLHPCDISGAALSAWRTYLADNEITQPFKQILQPVCFAPKSLIADKAVDLGSFVFNHSHVLKLVKKFDMTRLPVEDAGCFAGYYLEDSGSDIGVELIMEDLFVMCDPTDGRDLKVGFYRPSVTSKGYWSHGESGYESPDAVPTRISSSVLAALSAVLPGLPFEESGKVVPCKFNPFINENELAVAQPSVTPEQGYAPAGRAAAAAETAAKSEPAAPATPVSAPAKTSAQETPVASGPFDYAAYLECVEGTSSKFWKIEAAGDTHTVTYGRIGTAGTQSVKRFDSPAAALADAKKLTASKLKKGYVEK